jgi:hypothetical protein
LPTGAHILESQDIWIADTGATSHVTKHAGGRRKHCQTSVRTRGFAGETIKPDCEMDILVTYCDKEGTEKFDVVYGDVQMNERFNFNLLSVTNMLLKGYKLKGGRYPLTVWNQNQKIVIDIVIHTRNGALYFARFIRKSNNTDSKSCCAR